MDIDCNGGPSSLGGPCEKSTDDQPLTYFREILQSYHRTQRDDLDADVHSFVTFGNYIANVGTHGYKVYDPRSIGIEPYSIMAVICGDKLVSYGYYTVIKQRLNLF